ncbi:uncharacterized protein KQ657_001620 [Scheffersomyces spartinae]|uniref:Uncharacterized protein n=1 Tax=Scheffersomyces spartinae TaxID=45513 RepID=A0A9P7V797_9ASCO|nr:uncharacterized protein KQ657_001620 [Scheffersomyces spartinae]KAG7192525.1 hypothetical protein KQ657_001620 [Scheffersomyces spartinae]
MVAVPEPVKKVFEAFPLVEQMPVSSATPGKSAQLEQRKYYFTQTSETKDLNNDEKFTLGIHNVIEFEGRYIPTDPVSLSQALILCFRNGLKLPTNTSTSPTNGAHSDHAMLTLSYVASPDNELPILIEDTGSRIIRTGTMVNQILSNKYFDKDIKGLYLNQFLDERLYDMWVLCMLTEHENLQVQSYWNQTFSDMIGSDMELSKLFQDMTHWSGFRIRHAHLFNQLKTSTGDFWSRSNRKLLKNYYLTEVERIQKKLPILVQSVVEHPILKLKLASYIVIFDTLLSETRIGQVFHESDDLVDARKIILSY